MRFLALAICVTLATSCKSQSADTTETAATPAGEPAEQDPTKRDAPADKIASTGWRTVEDFVGVKWINQDTWWAANACVWAWGDVESGEFWEGRDGHTHCPLLRSGGDPKTFEVPAGARPIAAPLEPPAPEMIAWHSENNVVLRLPCNAPLPEGLENLWCSPDDEVSTEHLAAAKGLRFLRLSPSIDIAVLDALRGMESLEYLDLTWRNSGERFRDEGMAAISKRPSLRFLSLAGAGISDAGGAYLSKLPNLEHVNLSSTKITASTLKRLNPAKLRFLSLNKGGQRDVAMAVIAKFTELRFLDLRIGKVTDAGLAHLSGLSKLRILLLDGNEIQGTGLVHVGKLTSLTVLSLNGAYQSEQDLLGALSNLTNLRHLELGGNAVDGKPARSAPLTDAGLKHLAGLPLVYLNVSNTDTTDAGVEAAKAENPDLRVTHRRSLELRPRDSKN